VTAMRSGLVQAGLNVDVCRCVRPAHALVEPSVRLGLHVFEVAAEFGEAGRVGDRAVSRYDDAGCSASISCLQASIQPWIGPDHITRVDGRRTVGRREQHAVVGDSRRPCRRWCVPVRAASPVALVSPTAIPVRRGTPSWRGGAIPVKSKGWLRSVMSCAERVTGRQVEECIQVGRGRETAISFAVASETVIWAPETSWLPQWWSPSAGC